MRLLQIDAPELSFQCVVGDFDQRTGHFHAGGAGADHRKGQQCRLFGRVRCALGPFECRQQPASDSECVFQRFQAGCELRPLVVTEIAVRGTSGDDQIIVGQLAGIVEHDDATGGIDADDIGHQGRQVFLFRENMPDRRANRRRRQSRRGDLIQQRLK
jgi:hypothetical protein